jgi:hypothetical protein
MAIGFDGNTECLQIALSIPDINNVAGASMTCWVDIDSFPDPTYRGRIA